MLLTLVLKALKESIALMLFMIAGFFHQHHLHCILPLRYLEVRLAFLTGEAAVPMCTAKSSAIHLKHLAHLCVCFFTKIKEQSNCCKPETP